MFNRSLTPFGAAFTPPIEQSLIFDGSSYLSWTPAGAGNRRTWTFAAWVRRSAFGSIFRWIFTSNVSTTEDRLSFSSSDQLVWIYGGSGQNQFTSVRVFRDIGWFHLCLVVDTDNATALDRSKIYINGERIAVTNGGTPLQQDTVINSTNAHGICRDIRTGATTGDVALADIHFLDGTALTEAQIQSTFLQDWNFDNQVIPAPKKVTGLSYGTNGFHLTFADSAAFGDDTSGNGNDWTPTGFVAGDQTADVPGRPLGYFNPTIENLYPPSYLEGGRKVQNPTTSAQSGYACSLLAFDIEDLDGFYFESLIGSTASPASNFNSFGVVPVGAVKSFAGGTVFPSNGSVQYAEDGTVRRNGSTLQTYTSYGNNAVIGVFCRAGSVWFSLNGTFNGDPDANTGAAITGLTGEWFTYAIVYKSGGNTTEQQIRIDPVEWTGTAPTGANALIANNLPTPLYAGKNWFDANIRTGTGAAYTVTTGPANGTDLVWTKGRSGATDHALYDIVRGVQQQLESNTTTAETTETTGLTAFNSTGYSGGALAQMNTSAATYVDWMWGAGGAGVANTDGTISSTVSVAAAGHFSIVGYTGTGANATVGHGLPGAPECIIIKNRDQADAWAVYHSGVAADAETDYLVLNTTAAAVDDATYWQDTAPTSSVFSIGTAVVVNTNTEDYIAYCFRSVPGVCKVGSVVMNASTDGAYVDCGGTPLRITLKRIDSTSDWLIYDTVRSPINPADDKLSANSSAAEDTSGEEIDILSSGFKMRSTFFTGTWIYIVELAIPGGGDLPWPLAR